ncbi:MULTISPECIES: hypothetical protein [unclassified Sphingomonas]|uniref:hypothetical protein n=1 Tax=unclassified Sphingomonas TaxID=196159 RepID=UPI00226A89B9|nr:MULTISPECIES: hypothetical protein [unclassified Sphingomonas]
MGGSLLLNNKGPPATMFERTDDWDYATGDEPRLFLKLDIQRDGTSLLFRNVNREVIKRIYCAWKYVDPASGLAEQNAPQQWVVVWTVEWHPSQESQLASMGISKTLVADFLTFRESDMGDHRNINGGRYPVSIEIEFVDR